MASPCKPSSAHSTRSYIGRLMRDTPWKAHVTRLRGSHLVTAKPAKRTKASVHSVDPALCYRFNVRHPLRRSSTSKRKTTRQPLALPCFDTHRRHHAHRQQKTRFSSVWGTRSPFDRPSQSSGGPVVGPRWAWGPGCPNRSDGPIGSRGRRCEAMWRCPQQSWKGARDR